MSAARTMVVGIGSPHGDDQLGWLVADRLAAMTLPTSVDVHRAKSPIDLLDWLDHVAHLVICDACHGLGDCGKIGRYEWPTNALSEISISGTHDFSLPTTLALAERLGRLPRRVVVWVVEGSTAGITQTLSDAADAAVPKLVQQITDDLFGAA